MSLTPQQKEAAALWRAEQQEDAAAAESRSRARYLSKWLRDVGDTRVPEAEDKLCEIRRLAAKLHDLLPHDF